MTPELKPTPVYLPVSVEDELPSELKRYHVISKLRDYTYLDLAMLANKDKKTKGWYHPEKADWNNYPMNNITHWLKPIPDKYLLSKEEIEGLLGETFEAGAEDRFEEIELERVFKGERHRFEKLSLNKEQYIKKLMS
jgi:hypothetical protein